MLVDSHCHLNFPDYAEDREAVIGRAKEAGVGVMQTICTKMAEFDEIHAIAMAHEGIYCSVGVHPHEAQPETLVDSEHLRECTKRGTVIGIGETGLDYFYNHGDPVAQRESFHRHIAVARDVELPVIVHTRDADEDTVAILREEMDKGPFKALIHCFSSGDWLAKKVLEMGLYISVSGIATFKKAEELRDTLKQVPLDRLLVETDAPFLAPPPHRGKRNEPAYVAHVANVLAELHGITPDECARITTENFFRLFSRADKAEYLSVATNGAAR